MNLAERISRLERILLLVAKHVLTAEHAHDGTTSPELLRAADELSVAVRQPEFKGYAQEVVPAGAWTEYKGVHQNVLDPLRRP